MISLQHSGSIRHEWSANMCDEDYGGLVSEFSSVIN